MPPATPNQNKIIALLARHWAAFGYVCGVVFPIILRTGRRPVLFVRQTGLGDIVCTIPAVRLLRARHPGAPSLYNCHANFQELPTLAGVADKVTSLEAIGWVGHWYRFLLSGFYFFAHGDDLPQRTMQEPMVTEFCRQFDLPVTDQHPELTARPQTMEKVRARLRQKNLDPDSLVLIHPGPSWPIKEWPMAQWTELVAGLRAQGYVHIGQLGVGHYMNFGKVEVSVVPGAVSLLDAFNIEECLAAIASAKLFIGIDSGLLHLAAAARTPAVAVWGPTSPHFFYAESLRKNFVVSGTDCQGCYHRRPRVDWVTGCPHQIKCMETLPVEKVLAACLTQLKA